jgi:hypothetical protein
MSWCSTKSDRRLSIADLGLVGAVSLAGMALAMQGWKSHAPAFDMLPYFYGLDQFLASGAILQHGNLSSYGPFFPPGTFWLMLPGRVLFTDPRLFEKVGGALVYVGTLLGVLLLARSVFGRVTARWCVVGYGLSGLGLAFAGSLWPIGHPFFYVWTAYLAILWVTRRQAVYLVAAVVTFLLGMYVGMAIAPAAFLVAALWLVWRPPLWSRAWVAAIALVGATWFPYLQFESGRAFIDMRGMLLLQNVIPADYQEAWCDPGLTLHALPNESSAPETVGLSSPTSDLGRLSVEQRAVRRIKVIGDGLLATVTESTGSRLLALPLGLATLAALTLCIFSRRPRAQMMAIALGVPWSILLLVAEPDKPERFFWLWPLQVIALIGLTNALFGRSRHWYIGIGQRVVPLALVLVLAIEPLVDHLQNWMRSGWAGTDAEEVQVADALGSYLRWQGMQRVAIGYETYIYPFMADYHSLDPTYKVGAEFDLLLRDRYAITNLNQCAEGISSRDAYRVVQRQPQSEVDAPRNYFAADDNGNFHSVARVGSYEILERD